MNRIKYILILFPVFIAVSCDKENQCIKTAGSETTEIRPISSTIETIELSDKINLYIKQDSLASLKVVGGENMLPLVYTDVNGKNLKIHSNNKCDFLRSYDYNLTVFLTVPNLKKIKYNGQGKIASVNTLVFPEFEIEANKATGSVNLALVTDNLKIMQHTGPSDFTFVGSAKKSYLYSIGNGWFHFENFSSNEVHINSHGTGDIIVQANISLLVELYAIGNVYYYGNPLLTISQHTGSGEIKRR